MDTPSSTAIARQRLDDTRVLLNAVRKETEYSRVTTGSKTVTSEVFKWMGTIDHVTLGEYRNALNKPAKRNVYGGIWGSAVEVFMAAAKDELDAQRAALVLFASDLISPDGGKSWAAMTGTTNLPAYDDSAEYVTGLYDTLYHRPERLPENVCEALLTTNVFTASEETRGAIAALIIVTDALVQAEVNDYLITNEKHDENPPHMPYLSMNGRGSVWLKDEALSQYVMDNPRDAGLIAKVICERKTGDVGTIKAIIDHDVTAVNSGVL